MYILMITSGIEGKCKKKEDIIETNILSLVCTYMSIYRVYDLSRIKKKKEAE